MALGSTGDEKAPRRTCVAALFFAGLLLAAAIVLMPPCASDACAASDAPSSIVSEDSRAADALDVISALSVRLVASVLIQDEGWTFVGADDASACLAIGSADGSKGLEAFSLSVESWFSGSVTYRAYAQDGGWTAWASDGESVSVAIETDDEGDGEDEESLAALEAVEIMLSGDLARRYDVYYRVYAQDYGWLDWACNGQTAGTTGLGKCAEAIEIVLVAKGDEAPGDVDTPCVGVPAILTAVSVEDEGWLDVATSGEVAGTEGGSACLTAFTISLYSLVDGGICYQAHLCDDGWQDAACDGGTAGSTSGAQCVDAVSIELTGEAAECYDVWYRVYVEGYGWTGWAKNGATAGTIGLSLGIEALQVQVQAKGTDAPGSTENALLTCDDGVSPLSLASWSDVKAGIEGLLNTPYVWGGRSLSGWDCSGFVSYVMHTYYGTDWPGGTWAGSGTWWIANYCENAGSYVTTITSASAYEAAVADGTIQAGDILMFYTSGGATDHVAIAGEGTQLYHALSTSFGTGISDFATVWSVNGPSGTGEYRYVKVFRGLAIVVSGE